MKECMGWAEGRERARRKKKLVWVQSYQSSHSNQLNSQSRRINTDYSHLHLLGITHGLISTPRMRALEMLKKFLKAKPEVVSALIFVNDPHRVEIIYEKLLEMGFVAAPLHGESSKDDRKVCMHEFNLCQ